MKGHSPICMGAGVHPPPLPPPILPCATPLPSHPHHHMPQWPKSTHLPASIYAVGPPAPRGIQRIPELADVGGNVRMAASAAALLPRHPPTPRDPVPQGGGGASDKSLPSTSTEPSPKPTWIRALALGVSSMPAYVLVGRIPPSPIPPACRSRRQLPPPPPPRRSRPPAPGGVKQTVAARRRPPSQIAAAPNE